MGCGGSSNSTVMKKIIYILFFLSCSAHGQTRFYLQSTGTPAVTPAISATWNNTDNNIVRTMNTAKQSTTMSSNTGSVPNVTNTLFYQWVSAPLAAQTLSGNVKGQIRSQLNNVSGATCSTRIIITVVNSAGTIVATLLGATSGTATLTTTLTNRTTPASTALSSYACANGDRIVVEIGIVRTTGTTARNGTIRSGDSDAADLAENNTATTDNNPWVEFSSTINFQVAASTGNFLMLFN
jgi:hypothetical protein